MKSFFSKYTTTRNILFLLVFWIAFNIGFNFVFSGLEAGVLDIKPYYSADNAYVHMDIYGESGRQTYTKGIIMLDFAYPVVYALLFGFILFRLSQQWKLALLPFGILIFDYLENIAILTILFNYPARLNIVATISGITTSVKWLFVAANLLIIIYYVFRQIVFRPKM